MENNTGPWGQRCYIDGRPASWNNYSGGELVRFKTKKLAAAACMESRTLSGMSWEYRAERIPAGKTREACYFEQVLIFVRDALRGSGSRTRAIFEIERCFNQNGWGEGL